MSSHTLSASIEKLNQSHEITYGHPRHADLIRREHQLLRRLQQRGITTAADLVRELPTLSSNLKSVGIDLCYRLNFRNSLPALWKIIESTPSLRPMCGWVISYLQPNGLYVKRLIRIGSEQLRSPHPDSTWLAGVIQTAPDSDSLPLITLLLEIFEREDLPGRLRGDAADKLGCHDQLRDRRTSLYRRARTASLRGLTSSSIEVQFGSMYLIGSLCSNRTTPSQLLANRRNFKSALPLLRKITATDHRLSPGFWWPMSAEAEDILACITTGLWPDPDAGERFRPSGGPHGPREDLPDLTH